MLLASITLFVLAACSNVSPTPTLQETEFSSVASVEIPADTTQAELEALYGGTAFVFRPEAGFAVLGFSADQAALTTLSTDPSENIFATPEITAAGWDAWAGGHGAWSGGHGAWSGGHGAWSGGHGAWSGGWDAWAGGHGAWSGGNQATSTFSQNLDIWDQINLPEAQALAPNLGSGVKIAVIDTGIDLNHPAFAGKLAPASEWKDFVDGDSYPQEVQGSNYGHGTGVAGVILQVAPNVTILPLRVLDGDGVGDTDDVVAAMDWAIQKGADIINLSLGATVDDEALHTMIEYAFDQKVFVMASAGNANTEAPTFPARRAASGPVSEYTVGVGSVSVNDIKSPFSNYGDSLELMAPGERIYTVAPDESIGYWSGTSFATPIVTGALALGIGETDDPKQFANELSRTIVKINDKNTDYFGDKRYNKKLGKGRLDVEAFLDKVL